MVQQGWDVRPDRRPRLSAWVRRRSPPGDPPQRVRDTRTQRQWPEEEGCLLGFRGTERPEAAVADEDTARRPARLDSEEHRVGREPGGLDTTPRRRRNA